MDSSERHQLVLNLLQAGRVADAKVMALQMVARDPKDDHGAMLLAIVCLNEGNLIQGEFYARRALAIAPESPLRLHQAAEVMSLSGRKGEAYEFLRKSLAVLGRPVDGHWSAASVLARIGRDHEALSMCEAGLGQSPTDPRLRTLRAKLFLSCGHADRAVDELRSLMADQGDDVPICGLLCNALNYDHRAEPAAIRTMHQTFGRIVARHRPDRLAPRPNIDLAPDRRLRVGILSPDLRDHSCAFFIEPFFEHHDPAAFELHAYHTSFHVDATTARLKKRCASFRREYRISDQKIAELIQRDRIDVLIELSGHTAGGSPVTVHLKPAPVQISYLGYVNITGLDAVDARIVDSTTDPADECGSEGPERLVRIDPCFLCLRPPSAMPPVRPVGAKEDWLPRDAAGHITFGSFNAVQKLNDEVIALWVRVLGAVPGSRLKLKAMNLVEAPLREQIAQRFVQAGLERDRVEVLGPTEGRDEHLAAYHSIDTALDPFPYGGTTTTCDALLMGVPVVSMSGTTHASRVGASLLGTIGRPNWVARTQDEYVRIAATLAAERDDRVSDRTLLRDQVLASALCDGPAFARRFGAAIRSEWHRYVDARGVGALRSGQP